MLVDYSVAPIAEAVASEGWMVTAGPIPFQVLDIRLWVI